MVIFGHRRGGVQPQKNPEITFFKVIFSNSRGGPDPRSPTLDPRMNNYSDLIIQNIVRSWPVIMSISLWH